MESYYLMLDVGGTEIKAGILTGGGRLYENKIHTRDARAKETKEIIFENLAGIVRLLLSALPEGNSRVSGIGMAFPGPFDYERGISLMKGLDKYDSICGYAIGPEVMAYLKDVPAINENCPFLFVHDVEAFALGESCYGEAAGGGRMFALCIGTGCGSAFLCDNRVVKSRREGVPENGWIYNTPFGDGIVDDYLSVRGLRRLAEQLLFGPLTGVALWKLSEEGDAGAIGVFTAFGDVLVEAVMPFLNSYQPDTLALGGQICKSFSYFGKKLEQECSRRGIAICLSPDTSRRAMEGLYARFLQRAEQ